MLDPKKASEMGKLGGKQKPWRYKIDGHWYSTAQLADIHDVSVVTIRRWIKSGRLKYQDRM